MLPRPKPVKSYSGDTKSLLDSMMRQSNLPLSEQRHLRAAVDRGPSAQLAVRRRPLPVGRQPTYADPLRGVPINPALAQRIPGASRRSHADILAANGGSLEREQFRGGPPGTNREAAKEALQLSMQFKGQPPAQQPRREGTNGVARGQTGREPSQVHARSEEAKLRDAIMDEIEERQKFLETMRAMGNSEHEQAVTNQITERLADLKQLDKLEAKESSTST